MRLSFSRASIYAECARRGSAHSRRTLPEPDAEGMRKILVGNVLDVLIARAYEEGWYVQPPDPDEWGPILDEAIRFTTFRRMNRVYDPTRLAEVHRLLLPVVGSLHRQMVQFDLDKGFQTQCELSADWRVLGENVTLFGVLDLLGGPADAATLVDAKSGTYRDPQQLTWYAMLAQRAGAAIQRIGFWMPLTQTIEWLHPAKLPSVRAMVESAVDRIRRDDRAATPGDFCTYCPLLVACNEGTTFVARRAQRGPALADGAGPQQVSF